MNVSGIDCLRRELKTVLGILERRNPSHPLAAPTALVAHARQLMSALTAASAEASKGGDSELLEERLRRVHTHLR